MGMILMKTALSVPNDTNAEQHLALRTTNATGGITVLDLVVKSVESDLDAVECDHHTLGYVQRAGRVFVSLVGERADRAEECGQYLLWDKAADRLSSYCPHAGTLAAHRRN